MPRHAALVVVAVGLTLGTVMGVVPAGSGGSASTLATTPVARWEMNEPVGARTLVDGSGNGLHGTIGDDVRSGVRSAGATGYRFPAVAPNSPPKRPEHLVTVPHDPRLNPGTGAFSVTVRFRSTRSPVNIVQKGQIEAAGGYWKVELDEGKVICFFRGGEGQKRGARSTRRVDDGEWHTVTCERTPTSVTLYVDGVRHSRRTGPTGTIANTWELTVGGKSYCDQQELGCDYFSGDVDHVHVRSE